MREIRLIAPLHSNSGYGKAGRAMLGALASTGWAVQAIEVETYEVVNVATSGAVEHVKVPISRGLSRPHVQQADLQEALSRTVADDAPTLIMHNPDGLSLFGAQYPGLRVGLTMLEADTIAPHWSRTIANVDLLLVASEWNAVAARPHMPDGVDVHAVGLCADERLWSPEGHKWVPPAPKHEGARLQIPSFLFLSVFATSERKHWRQLIQAFAEEFRGDDAGLVLKASRIAEVVELVQWARALGVWIEIVEGELRDEEMAALYRGCDCYALPSVEGFGLTHIEAALCGLQLVGLDGGGTADFISEEVGVPIDVYPEPCAGLLPHVYRSAYSWPTATVPSIRRALRQAFDEREAGKGAAAREMALSRFSRQAVGVRVGRLIDALRACPKVPASQAADVPNVVAVVTTCDHIEQTRLCVEALQRTVPGIRILLADDGSTDGTAEWAATVQGLTLVQCDSGGNVSANRQQAIEYVWAVSGGSGLVEILPADIHAAVECIRINGGPMPFVVFFDNDVEVQEGWWTRLAAHFAEHPKLGILAPRKVFKATGIVQNVGNRIVPDGTTGPLHLDRSLVWCDYVETAAMAVRPEVWSAQKWDPQFPIFYEDVDYCFQARAAGWLIAATADVTVIHDAHTTSVDREDEADRDRRPAFLRKWKDAL